MFEKPETALIYFRLQYPKLHKLFKSWQTANKIRISELINFRNLRYFCGII